MRRRVGVSLPQNNHRGHLDEFPSDMHMTAWEVAVLERERSSASYKYAGWKIRGEECRKERAFWPKLGASESSEIYKKAQNRIKKPTSRIEKWEELEECRRKRAVRFGLSDQEDSLHSEERIRRRAKRFGIDQSDFQTSAYLLNLSSSQDYKGSGKKVNRAIKSSSSLKEYSENLIKLEQRRARFAQEPREDRIYQSEWKSDSLTEDSQLRDAMKMAGRKVQFSLQSGLVHKNLRNEVKRSEDSS